MLKYILAGSAAVIAVGVVALKSDLACEYSPIDLSFINDCSAQNKVAKTGDVNTSENEKSDQSAGSQEMAQTGSESTSEVASTTETVVAEIVDPNKPTFDLVRVEPDGSTLVAGRGAPNSTILLKDGDKTIGETVSSDTGEWVIIVDEPIQAATATLSLIGMMADGTELTSDAVVNIAMRNDGATTSATPVVAASEATAVVADPKMEALAAKLAAMNEDGGVTLGKLENSQDGALKALAAKLRAFGNDDAVDDELNLTTIASQLSELGADDSAATDGGDSGIDFGALAAKLNSINSDEGAAIAVTEGKTELNMASLATKLADMKASGGVTLTKLEDSQDEALLELAAKLRSFGNDEGAVVKNGAPNEELNLMSIAKQISDMGGDTEVAADGGIDFSVLAAKLSNIDDTNGVVVAEAQAKTELDMNALATKLADMKADGGVTLEKLENLCPKKVKKSKIFAFIAARAMA